MPAREIATLYTAVSHEGVDGKPYPHPYRRVVGIDALGKSIRTTVNYPRRGVKAEPWILDRDFLHKLNEFYERFLVHRSNEPYNCHTFAAWMNGQRLNYQEAGEWANEVIAGGVQPAKPRLARGVGVVGVRRHYRQIDSQVFNANHSVASLGPETLECMQVISRMGYLGIDTYKGAKDASTNELTEARLFVPA